MDATHRIDARKSFVNVTFHVICVLIRFQNRRSFRAFFRSPTSSTLPPPSSTMPTATTTTHTANSKAATIPLKSAFMHPPSSSTVATLKSLYPRAATAFLQRDVALTHSLLTSAFAILTPPFSTNPEDSLSSQRRKWDLLRITFETTTYASPPPNEDPEALPAPLRANQMLSPQSFVAALHARSLQLFSPTAPLQKPSSSYLPAQILVTLGLASLKLECPDIGRGIIEDWLARRGQTPVGDDHEGYAKVLDLYCLQILPRLEEWDYAGDFLQYERELPQHTRDVRHFSDTATTDLYCTVTRQDADHLTSLCRRFAHEEKLTLLMGDLSTEGMGCSSALAADYAPIQSVHFAVRHVCLCYSWTCNCLHTVLRRERR